VVLDSVVIANPTVHANEWRDFYVNGGEKSQTWPYRNNRAPWSLTMQELQAVTVDHPDYGSAWRQRGLHAVTSSEFRSARGESHHPRQWKDLKKIVN